MLRYRLRTLLILLGASALAIPLIATAFVALVQSYDGHNERQLPGDIVTWSVAALLYWNLHRIFAVGILVAILCFSCVAALHHSQDSPRGVGRRQLPTFRYKLSTLLILITACAISFALMRADLFVVAAAVASYGVASIAMAYIIARVISGINSLIGRLQGKR